MTKSFNFASGCLAAATAVLLALSADVAGAQDRRGAGGPGPGMMQPGSGPHGPGGAMMGRGAQADGERGYRRGREGWRERRRARRMARRIEILDTDNDGKVTLAEINAEQRRLLGAADVNGDGKLSVDEFRRRGRWFMRLQTISFFDMLDTNGDGQLTAEEITNPTGRWFKRYDENNDKALDGDALNKSSWHHRHRGGRRGRR